SRRRWGREPRAARERRKDRIDRDRPNILLVMTDQQRWDALGCVGGWVDTPNMDRIAAEGGRFSNAYTNSPVCVPARGSLPLGRYPHSTREGRHQPHTLPAQAPTRV